MDAIRTKLRRRAAEQARSWIARMLVMVASGG
jgi:hypothetical protein